jgi:hypothetical protein
MSQALEKYLDQVLVYANRPTDQATAIRAELKDHLMEKVAQLQAQGTVVEDAVFAAIEDHGAPRVVGYRLRPRFPLIDIRSQGTARGVIAIGPKAVGVFAFGGVSVGVFACGGVSAGVITFGGICAALLYAWAGIGVGAIVFAGIAFGLLAVGGLAVGIVAVGATAIGFWAQGARCLSYYNTSDVPPILTTFDHILTNQQWFFAITGIGLAIMLPLILITNVLQYREYRRVRAADVWAVE